MLEAACLALNQVGEGSNPSDPTRKPGTGRPAARIPHPGHRPKVGRRRRGFESHPVLSIFDNSTKTLCTHDVAAACCLAMADVRVRLPLGAFAIRAWESLEFRLPRAQENAGSNPAALTDSLRWGLCWYRQAPVKRSFAGSIPATAAFGE